MCHAWYGTGLLGLAQEIVEVNTHQVSRYILGGAPGWDTAMALACIVCGVQFQLELPDKHRNIIPLDQRTLYDQVLSYSSLTRYHGDGPTRSSLMQRNRAIVDQGDALFAMWDGKMKGGTSHAVSYAMRSGKPIYNYYPALRARRPAYGSRASR